MGLLTLQQRTLLGSGNKSSRYWNFIASYTEKIPFSGFRYGLVSAIPGIVAEVIFFLLLLVWGRKQGNMSEEERKAFLRSSRHREGKADELIFGFIKRTVFAVTGFISIFTVMGRALFQQNSFEYFVFVYPWPKGLHIFTISRCVIMICLIVFLVSVILELLSLLGMLAPSKQETVIRMLISFIKYGSCLGTLYYCLTILGAPTSSLLASAGVISIIFSLGAQNLVADIVSGLFIIFEGSFKVGDMITVNDWHGQVVEIGIRNTTIRDLINSDVKIINNSMIKNVINYSVYPSFCAIKINIEYGTNLPDLEAIIEREKPVIKRNMPYIIGEPMYLGVDEFAESAIILKFQVAVRNQDYLKAKRALNREIKLMFDRNGITVPFPQIVVNEKE